MPKSSQRCVTNLSSSSKVPSSRSRVTRSRAVSLPALCSRSRRSSPLPASASALRRRRSLKRSLRIESSAMVCCLRDFRTGSNWFATNFWGDLPGSYLQAKVENQPVQRRECERPGASRDRCIRAEAWSRKECPWRPPGYEATDWRLRQPRSCPAPGQSWWLASARRHRSPRSHRRKSSLSRGGSGATGHLKNPKKAEKIMHESLVNARPVVGHEDRVAGVRRVILHARGLACGKALQAKPLFKTRDVLGGFVGDAGNRVAVSN